MNASLRVDDKYHTELVGKLRAGLYGARDLLSHHLIILGVLSGTAGLPDLATNASILAGTSTFKGLCDLYGIKMEKHCKSIVQMAARHCKLESNAVSENVICKWIQDNGAATYYGTIGNNQSFFNIRCDDYQSQG